MRATVHLPGPLLPLSEGRGTLTVEPDGSTVADVLASLFARHPPLRARILDEQGRVRPHVNVFVDHHSIRHTGGLSTPVTDGAVVSVIPAVSGGVATDSRTASCQALASSGSYGRTRQAASVTVQPDAVPSADPG